MGSGTEQREKSSTGVARLGPAGGGGGGAWRWRGVLRQGIPAWSCLEPCLEPRQPDLWPQRGSVANARCAGKA